MPIRCKLACVVCYDAVANTLTGKPPGCAQYVRHIYCVAMAL